MRKHRRSVGPGIDVDLSEQDRKDDDKVPVRVYNAKKPGAVVLSSDVAIRLRACSQDVSARQV